MAFDFPASPTVGTVFAPAGGPSWQWNGTVWVQTAASGFVPEAPLDNQPYVRANGQWAMQPGTADTYNRAVNGGMQHSQENGNTAGTTLGYYMADQWSLAFNGTTPSINRTYPTSDIRISPGYITLVSSSKPSLAAGDYAMIEQRIEGTRICDLGWGAASPMSVVLAFSASTNTPGTYAVALRNDTGTRSYVIPVALTSTLQRFAFAIPGCPDGTWQNSSAFSLDLTLAGASGSSLYAPQTQQWQSGNYIGFAGMSNLCSAAGQAINLGRVGLYADPSNTGRAPSWQTPDAASELIACKRYYQSYLGLTGFAATRYAADPYRVCMFLYPVAMRAAPTSQVRGNIDGGAEIALTVDSTHATDLNVAHTGQTNFVQITKIILNARM